MIGGNIKRLRTEKGMTQKNLADKLFVSAQAVSRWENDEVEPSLGTIAEMAKIFEVSTDEILGVSAHEPKEEPKTEEPPKAEPQVIVEKEYVYKEPPKQMLALCHQCNSPIYERSDIFREYGENGNRILCQKCHQKIQYMPNKNFKGITAPFPFRTIGQWYDYQCNFIYQLDLQPYYETLMYQDQVKLFQVVLYKYKKEHFNLLSKKERRYIRCRHYAVMSVSYRRNKKLIKCLLNLLLAILIDPILSIKEARGLKKRKKEFESK